jgi:hypothetical protein
MAIARKCDRCGKLYEPYRTKVSGLKALCYANGFVFAERNLGGLDASTENKCRDLCSDCFESLLAWLWEKKEVEADVD